jgi:hypothetical protein
MADGLRETAQAMEVAELPDLRLVGVGWGKDGREIDVGGAYVFKAGRDEQYVIDIMRALAWGLFEARRDAGDPRDPKRLAWVRGILQEIGERILGPRQPECSKCNDLRRICVACDGECKIGYEGTMARNHDRAQALCPERSAWLAPQAPR